MKGNSHFDLAQTAYTRSLPDHAQVQATLALAYEQRTANLLALMAIIADEPSPEDETITDEILSRLGLSKS